MKKWLITLMVLLVAFGACTGAVAEAALSESPLEDFKYSIADGKVTITRYTGTEPTVVIPAEIDDLPVVEVVLASSSDSVNPYVRKVVLPDTPIRIGNSAFNNYRYLQEIIGLENVTSVGTLAFSGTDNLEALVFSDALCSIGSQGIDISGVQYITIPDDVELDRNPFGVSPVKEFKLIDGSDQATVALLDGLLTSADHTKLICYPSGWTEISFRIPDAICELGRGSIYIGADGVAEKSLMELSIPAAVETIHSDSIKTQGRVRLFVAPDSAGLTIAQEMKAWHPEVEYIIVEDGDQCQSISARVKEIVAAYTNSSMSDFEKARAMIDWCAENTTYSLGHGSPYDILFDGKGTCAAYTDAYLLLMEEMGIPCKAVANFDHGLNAIQIDGQWIYADPTNCCHENLKTRYRRFAFEDTVFEAYYGGLNLDFGDTVTCTTARYHYYYTNGYLDRAIADAQTRIQEKLNMGNTFFSIEADSTLLDISTSTLGGDHDLCALLVAAILKEREWLVNGSVCSIFCSYEDGAYFVTMEEQPEDVRVFEYDIVNNMARITGYKGAETAIIIPAEIDGYAVGYIGGAFTGNQSIKKVTLPDTIVGINANAFCECIDLTTINFPSSLKEIGNSAFEKCHLLNSPILLPDGMTNLGEKAFAYCSSIEAVSLPGTLKKIADMTFLECTKLSSLTLGEGIFHIAAAAFSNCESLSSVILPESLDILGNGVFASTALTSLHIPAHVSVIGTQLVHNCSEFTSLTIDTDNERFMAVDNCVYALNNGVPVTLKFSVSGVTEVSIPDTVSRIDNSAFAKHPTLTKVHIPGSVKYIGENAFSECQVLREVTMGEGVETIDYGAFSCASLTSIQLADSITSIAGTALWNTVLLTELRIPKGMTALPSYFIFAGKELHLYVHEDVTEIGEILHTTHPPYRLYIHGKMGTYAQTFAAENGYVFVSEEQIICPQHIEVVAKAVAATCTETGLTEGRHCDLCGEVLMRQEIIPALGHTEVIDEAVTPTCTKAGLKEGKHCSVCGEILVAQEIIPALGHAEVIDEAVAPTCTKAGLKEGKHCSVCGEIFVAQEIIPALGHTEVIDEAVAPTCTKAGLKEGKHCSVCGEILVVQEIIPALGHTEVIDEAVAPTCTQTGLTEGKHCSVCGEVLVAQEIVPALAHTEVIDEAVAPTCTETGLTEGKRCSVCGEVLVAQEIIPALGHTEVIDEAVAPTCTETGLTEGKHCSVCGEVLVAQEIVPALGHTEMIDKAVAPTCTEAGLTEGKHCSVCGEVLVAQEIVPALGHIEVIDEAVAPTCTETGLTEGKHCSVCSEVLTVQETIPILEHTVVEEEGFKPTDFTNGQTAGSYCSSCGEKLSGYEIIPAFCVVKDGVLAKYNGATEELVIPEGLGINAIGDEAFYGNTVLKSIVIPEGVISIGERAFLGCSGLMSIYLPESMITISDIAFFSDYDMTFYCKAGTAGSYAVCINGYCFVDLDYPEYELRYRDSFDDESGISIVRYQGNDQEVSIPSAINAVPTKEIGVAAFWGRADMTKVVIPDSITKISPSAFGLCSSLVSVKIPDSVASIGYSAFYGCSSLSDIVLPNGLTEITDGLFKECTNLGNVTLPDSLKTIGSEAFSDCSKLNSFVIPESVTSIGSSAFAGCRNLVSVTIPDSVTSIGVSAFTFCSRLTSVKIPYGVTSIGSSTFWECGNLVNVRIPDGVTSIGQDAFFNCKRLESIDIPDSVRSIGENAFYGCGSLRSVDIPYGVTSIETYTFYGCSNLESVTIPNSVTHIGNTVFYNCKSLKGVTIPDSVTSMGSSVFSGCSGLAYVKLPRNITSINFSTFSGCSSLMRVDIPERVTNIWGNAFYNCKKLTGVEIPESVISIHNTSFSNCSSLVDVVIYGSAAPTYLLNIPAPFTVYCHRTSGVYSWALDKGYKVAHLEDVWPLEMTLKPEVGSVKLNETMTVAVNVFPAQRDQSIMWISSDPRIAMVENGVVTGLAWGKTMITAMAESGVSASCEVTVTHDQHKLAIDMAIAPTCTETGITEGSHCIACGYVAVVQEIIPALGHSAVIDEAVASTCIETGLMEGKHCAVCSEVLVEQEIIPALGHNEVVDEAVAPSCTHTGLTEGRHCAVCGEVLITQTVINASGHKETTFGIVKAPTCTETGMSAGTRCSICREILHVPETIPALGHTEVIDEAVIPICAETGLTEGKHCSVCGEVLVAQEIIPALGHSLIVETAVPATHVTTGLTEGSRCERCGKVYIAQEIIPVVAVPVMTLPSALKEIKAGAFSGSAFVCVVIPEGCHTLDVRAFADSASLRFVEIPATVTQIDAAAFSGCSAELIIVTTAGSMAEAFAQKQGICCVLK